MADDVFCKIVRGELPVTKVWENEGYLAFLSINPNTEGLTVVIPKKHFESDFFLLNNDEMCGLIEASKEVVGLIKKGLGVERVAMVAEGMGVNHVHIKLFPLHGIGDEFSENFDVEPIYLEKYEGYITTQLGPDKSQEDLESVAKKIRG